MGLLKALTKRGDSPANHEDLNLHLLHLINIELPLPGTKIGTKGGK
jgi:hypothetical protein